jgi:hypothetical protein
VEDIEFLVDFVVGNSSIKLQQFLKPIKIVKYFIFKSEGWVVNPTN